MVIADSVKITIVLIYAVVDVPHRVTVLKWHSVPSKMNSASRLASAKTDSQL